MERKRTFLAQFKCQDCGRVSAVEVDYEKQLGDWVSFTCDTCGRRDEEILDQHPERLDSNPRSARTRARPSR
jgi:transcription elongation factor Elf1